ncbi:hypothetical protein JCM10207_000984 [Rhodosporidiobolus poonsookiae]
MPELPEVEEAKKRLKKLAKGKKIGKVDAKEDPIVFSGTTHAAFATSIEGKTVEDVRRLGKNFYLVLSSGPHPIFHFGMSGMAQIRGEPSPVYRVPRASQAEEWPPKYLKTRITFVDPDEKDENGEEKVVGEWAFCDARRLGRIKLVDVQEGEEIEKVAPLSELGADPLLNMPSVDSLRQSLAKRNAPIKAVLLDQNGPLCGIGNYMVDEILYQSAIHPSHPASALAALPSSSSSPSTSSFPSTPAVTLRAPHAPSASADPIQTLHANIQYVTRMAVDADADASRFPQGWLFHHRWGKGKKGQAKEMVLPDGSTSPISFSTVGGRTSCIVDTVQILPPGLGGKSKGKATTENKAPKKGKGQGNEEESNEDGDERLDEEAQEMDEEEEAKKTDMVRSPHFKRTSKRKATKPDEDDEEAAPSPSKRKKQKQADEVEKVPTKATRPRRGNAAVKYEEEDSE